MSTSVYSKIHTNKHEFIVNGILGGWPSVRIGQATNITVYFHDDGTLVVPSGETHTVTSETAEFYESVQVDGDLVINGELVIGPASNRWQEVEQYGDYAGHASTGLGLNTVPFFNDQLDSDADINSLVIGFEPSPKMKDRDRVGFWGILTNMTDQTNAPISRPALDIEAWVLAKYSDYDSAEAVRNDLEG